MAKLFWYTRLVTGGKGENPQTFNDSFNLDFVLRTVEHGEKFVVLLSDGHEEARDVPVEKMKGKIKVVEMTRQRMWIQSEIVLDGIDKTRFMESTGYELGENTEEPLDKNTAAIDALLEPQVEKDLEKIKEEEKD